MKAALKQIQEKDYDAELTELGFGKEQIRHYGFAFSGKQEYNNKSLRAFPLTRRNPEQTLVYQENVPRLGD